MKRILILGEDNSLQSQMAEGYFNFYGNKFARFYSCGLTPTKDVFPGLVRSMAEDGLDLSDAKPKKWNAVPSKKWDLLLVIPPVRKKDIPKEVNFKRMLKLDLPEPKTKKDGTSSSKAMNALREQVKVECLKFIGKEFLVESTDPA